jgi:YggT family protein
MTALIAVVHVLATILSVLVLAEVLMSFFLSPYHPARRVVGNIVNPLLAPIRRLLPSLGGFDFSPLILLIIIQIIEQILVQLLSS